jgi:hypothetical protein
MMNTDGIVPGNLPNVSQMYCACRATQALSAGVVDLGAAPRHAAPEQRFHQREFFEFARHADTGTSLLNAHLAPS